MRDLFDTVIAGPWTIAAVVGLLAGWAVSSGYRLWMRTDTLIAEVRRATRLIARGRSR